jgi:signal transduction histidine kinase
VLEYSKIEAGDLNLADDRVELAVVARTCVAMVRPKAAENQVQLECTIAQATLRIDRLAIIQVVSNILANAVKFTPRGGLVSICSECTTDGDLVIIVTDTGIGIDPAVLAALCAPFSQAEASMSRRYNGTGLGLAISRRLVALHGGTLTIESAPGQGTTVRIKLPAVRLMAGTRPTPTAQGVSA